MTKTIWRVALTLLCASTAASAGAYAPAAAPRSERALQLVHENHGGAAQATGVVNTIDAEERKVNVSHGSIKQLGWPAMTMDFAVSKDVDLSLVKAGMKVTFTLVRGSGGAWTVDTLKPVQTP